MKSKVVIYKCSSYDYEELKSSIEKSLKPFGGLSNFIFSYFICPVISIKKKIINLIR